MIYTEDYISYHYKTTFIDTSKISTFLFCIMEQKNYLCHRLQTVVVAQLVRALDCGSRGRRFEPGLPPLMYKGKAEIYFSAFLFT